MTADITYHRLDAANAHCLVAATVFDNPVDPDELARFQADEGHELVFALQGGEVVGFASGVVLLHPDKPPAFFVSEVDVAPRMQRRGVGTALCQRLIGLARDRGCQGVWLATEEGNAAARALYRALEGRETPGITVYDWDGVMDP